MKKILDEMYASVKLQFTNEKSPLDEIRPSVKLQITYEKKNP